MAAERNLSEHLEAVLYSRRVVLVSGCVDVSSATRLSAQLLSLDAVSDEPIDLRLTACEGPLDVALSVLDVIDEVGVPIRTEGFGRLMGGPVLLLAAGRRRRIAEHATLVLREGELTAGGVAAELERQVAAHLATSDAFLAALAPRCRRPVDAVRSEWERRAVLTGPDAVALGYADAVT